MKTSILTILLYFTSFHNISESHMIPTKVKFPRIQRLVPSNSMRRSATLHASSPLISAAMTYSSLQKGFLGIRSDPWYIWSMLSMASTAGLLAEKTNIGATLSSPLTTTLLTMLFCNIGLLPAQSPVYNTIMKVLVPLAIPLLLLDADMKKCIKKTGSLLNAFLVGALGTFVGTLVAYMLVPMKNLPGATSIAGALCARHIGGAVNFVAVTEILGTPADVVAAALAADNVIVALYFTFLFAISSPGPNPMIAKRINSSNVDMNPSSVESAESSTTNVSSPMFTAVIEGSESITSEPNVAKTAAGNNSIYRNNITLLSLSQALTLSLLLYTISCVLSKALPGSLSPILLVSLLVIFVATSFSKVIGGLSESGGVIGVLFMQLFFAVIGSMGHIPTVMEIAPSLFVHTAVQIMTHFSFSMIVAKYLGIPFNEMVLASNANVGGPTTAAAMASNKRWQNLVLPALLTGVFGYAIATVIGVGVTKLLPFLPCR